MTILGIETSCDETSAAVVQDPSTPPASIPSALSSRQGGRIEGFTILSNVIASQTDLHAHFGGVVPEIASRRHVELIIPTIQEALDVAGVTLDEIDCIGVINRPGLIGALIVGVAAAKSIAYSRGIPLVPVHHLEAHIYANWLGSVEAGEWRVESGKWKVESGKRETQRPGPDEAFHFPLSAFHSKAEVRFPVVCLVVSGGHTDLILMTGHGKYEILARTRDDAAGEAFDKCARAMGLGYPGGPLIDELAKDGNPRAVAFPRAKVGDRSTGSGLRAEGSSLDFSFSGLKTAVIRYVEGADGSVPLPDLAASFQEAVVDVLVDHTFRAATERGVKQVLVAGGVAANTRLQAAVRSRGEELGIEVIAPPPILCTDNAAMAAAAAYFIFQRGEVAGLDLDCYATEALGVRS